jgi:hypothetical protein
MKGLCDMEKKGSHRREQRGRHPHTRPLILVSRSTYSVIGLLSLLAGTPLSS